MKTMLLPGRQSLNSISANTLREARFLKGIVVLSICAVLWAFPNGLVAQATFQVGSLSSGSAIASPDIEAGSGDDRGGIAVTNSWVYRVQDVFTARLDPNTLTINNSSLPRRDGIFSDLATGQLWTLWDGSSEPVNGVNTTPFMLTAIRQMDADLNILGTQVNLSTSIMVDANSCIFAGRGFFLIWRSGTQTFFAIDIATGNVTTLGTVNIAGTYYPCENWLAWGIAEYFGGTYYAVYHGNGGNANRIMRRNASTGAEVAHTIFSSLGDCGAITISPWHNRWYGHAEGGSEFSAGNERSYSGAATMLFPPAPTISSFTPSGGPGQTITINGTNFTGVTQVRFGGVNVASFNVVSATQITAVVNGGASGGVSVDASGGTANLAGFTYIPPAVQTIYTSRGPSNALGLVRNDGSMNTPSLLAANFPRDVVRFGAYIYWADETMNRIGRANADGSSPDPNFITGCSMPNGVAATATHVYWTNYGSTTIGRANADGTGVNQSFCSTGLSQPVGITVNTTTGFIYWSRTNFGTIGRVQFDGVTGLNGSFITGLISPGGILTDAANNYIYWTESGASNSIRRAQLSTGTGVTTIVTGCSGPVGITTDGSFLYWSNPGLNAIGRSILAGSGAVQSWATGFANIRGVSVGVNPSPAPTVTMIAPNPAAIGQTVTITGTNLTGASAVRLGGIAATGVTPVSATQVTAVVAAGTVSGNIAVDAASGTGIIAGFVLATPPTAFSAATPPTGTVGSAYTYTFVANGNPAPNNYAVQSGTLPPGLTLNAATGVLSGTPTGAGGMIGPIVIRATNTAGFFDCTPFNITINAAPTAFSAQTPPNGTISTLYAAYNFVADGFPAPTYAVFSGTLPAGLILSGAGVLSGTPTGVAQVYGPIVVRATNVAGNFNTLAFNITVNGPPTLFSAAAPPAGTVGSAYTYTFVANGIPTPTSYALQSGTLPAGLTLNPATGVLSGTPTGTGGVVGPIVIRATNPHGFFDCAPFSIPINAPPTVFSAQTPPIGVPSVAYGPYNFLANGYPAPTYTVQTGGALPAGLTLSAGGVLSGTPSVSGIFGPYTIRATNFLGTFDTAPFTLTIGTAPTAYSAQTPPSGAVGLTYSYIITANGQPAPTYAIQSGSLPSGLSLNTATGEISGTPSAIGTFGPVVIRATNIMGSFDTAPFSITINIAPSAFSAQTPPNGTVGTAFNYTYSANGTPAPSYSLFGGTLPPGVVLNGLTGQLAGTPTTGGIYSGIVIRASNVAGVFNSTPATINISGAPTAFAASPANGVVGTPYSYTFAANGFPAPTYSLFSGVLPPGLSLNAATGELSGTPTIAGVFGVTVIRATNGAGQFNSNSFSITITATGSSPTAFSAASPGTATSGTPYSYTFVANGFPSPAYSLASGTLPPGLTLNAATGELSGTPTASGVFGPITIQAANASGTLISSAFSINVNGAPTAFSAQTPGNGVVGTPYNYAFAANGLPAPNYTVLSGTLPTGLNLSGAGVISGTPSVAGTFGPIVVQASNGAGSVNSIAFSITISATGTAPTAFTLQSPPNGLVANAYAYTFAANGSPAPTFTIISGTLPTGLSLTPANGLLSGTPSVSGVFGPITLSAANGFGTVNSVPFNITVNAAPTAFSAQSPPSGAVGAAYSYTFAANGFPAPTYTPVGGTLPPGLSLSASGVLSGTPSAAGTYSGILIQAQNAFGNVNTVNIGISISSSLVAPTAFTAQTPPNGNVSAAYSYTMLANGSPSPTYSVIAGTLPTGLTLNAATGLISGIPSVVGTFGPITIQASNGAGMFNSTPFSITINQAPPTITSFTPTGAPAGATITINGTNLTGISAVSFGGVAAASFTPISAVQATAVVAAGGATGNVSLTTPGGTASLGVFSFFSPPTITSFSPIIAAQGATVTITGTGFTGATQVQFGGVNAASFMVVSPTQITAVVPLGAPNMPISVTTPAGTVNSAVSFTLSASSSQFYYQAGPADNPANWNSLPNGGGLTASNFTTAGQQFVVAGGKTALFNVSSTVGAGVTMQVENGGVLSIANGATLDIQGSFRVNSGGRLQLQGSGAVASVSGVQYLGQNAVLEYKGSNNRTTSNVEFPSTFAASVTIDSGSVRLNGTKSIAGALTFANNAVLNLGMGNGLVLEGETNFADGKFGSDASNDLIIGGSGALNGTVLFDALGTNRIGSLKINRTNANLRLRNALEITGSLGLQAGLITLPAGQNLTLLNTADTALQGGSQTSYIVGSFARRLSANLTPNETRVWTYPLGKSVQYLPAVLHGITTGTVAPIVAMEVFNSGAGGSVGIGLTGALSRTEYWQWLPLSGDFGGAKVGLIRGNLNDSTRVASSLTQSGVYQNIGGERIAFGAGAGVSSDGVAGNIGTARFFALAGAGAAAGDTTTVLTPRIRSFSPDKGSEETVVNVVGENLNGINTVAIGTLPVQSFRVVSSTGITITVGKVRTGPIQIGGPNGGAASSGVFTFLAAPVIQSVSPQTAGPGATVTISGENLQNVTTLTFGGVTISTFTINPDGTITFIVPQGASSGTSTTQIQLNAAGGAAQATTSVVVIPTPTISSFMPTTDLTGATVVIRGRDFVNLQSVRFGQGNLSVSTSFTLNDSSQISTIVPARILGMGVEVPITLVFGGGVRVTTATMFTYRNVPTTVTNVDNMTRFSITEFVDKIVPNGGEVRVRGSNLNFINDISLRTSVSTGKAEYRLNTSEEMTLILPRQNLLMGTGGTVSSSATTVVFLGAYNSVVSERAFTIMNSPTITSITPQDALIGDEITITGTSLDLVTGVTIGGTSASFRPEGTTRIIVRMPERIMGTGLPLSGAIVLTSIGGIRTSSAMIVNANLAGGLPTITSFSPASGTGGAVITVTGANLSVVNAVNVGDISAAAFTLVSPTVLRITLPSGVSRRTSGLIRLQTPAGEAVSREPFRFTESLEADSVRVAEFLRMAPQGALLNWSNRTAISEWQGLEVVNNRIVGIRLPGRNLTGALPPGISGLNQIKTLDLSGNGFTGNIPTAWAALVNLEEFNMRGNRLSGALPSQVCSWQRLRRFDVSSNELSGEIPECIHTLENGEVVNLSNNQFSGKIPWKLAIMTSLRELRLANNRLTGELPPEFGTVSGKVAVNLEKGSNLSQTLTLQVLDLGGNLLEGRIPEVWANMTNLREFNVSQNRLTGFVPRGIAAWRSLTSLRLADNAFEGELPSGVQWENLVEFIVENNRFTGAMPLELSQSSRLRVIRAKNNRFTALPNLARTRIDTLSVENNNLEFGSLEPMTKLSPGIRSFGFLPQALVGRARDTVLERGALLLLPSEIRGESTQYQWYKDNSLIRGNAGRQAIFRVDSAIRVNSGVYFCRATNPALPGLTLETQRVSVSVASVDVLLGVPDPISPAPGAVNVSPNLTLRWTRIEGATDYEVRWWKQESGRRLNERADTLAQPDNGEPIYVLRGLERGAEYYWSARALIRDDRGSTIENGNASQPAYFKVVVPGVDLAFSTVDAGKSTIADNRDVPGGILINVSGAPLTILQDGIAVISRDSAFRIKTEQVAGIVRDTVLLPNGELALGIEFTPAEAEPTVASLQVRYRDAQGTNRTAVFNDALRGRGSALAIRPVDFDTVRVGKSTVQSVEVTNRSKTHTMRIDAVQILAVRGAPSERSFALLDARDLLIAPSTTAYISIRCAPLEAGVRRAGVRIIAVSTRDTSVTDFSLTSLTAFARFPKPDDAAVSLKVSAVPESAPPGALVNLNVIIENPTPIKLKSVFEAADPVIQGRVQFSRQVLTLASSQSGGRLVPDQTGADLSSVLFDTRWEGRSGVIATLQTRALAGSKNITPLIVASIEWGKPAKERMPWERKVFVEEPDDNTLATFTSVLSRAGGQRLITGTNATLRVTAIAPNPVKDAFEVSYSLPENDVVTISLVDSRGVEVQTLMTQSKEAGQHKESFKIGYLASGSYLVKVSGSRGIATGRVDIVR